MRIVFGLILLATCVFAGFWYSRKFTLRRKEFEFLKSFNARVKNEVFFSKGSLVSLVKKLEDERAIADYVKRFFIDKKDDVETLGILKKEEKEYIADYVKKLGQGDAVSQKEFLTEAGAVIDGFLSESTEKEKRYAPLCLKLGFLFGLIILIILL